MRQLTDSEMAHLAASWRRYKSEYETEPTHIWPFEHGFTGGLDTAAEQVADLQADNTTLRMGATKLLAYILGDLSLGEIAETIEEMRRLLK